MLTHASSHSRSRASTCARSIRVITMRHVKRAHVKRARVRVMCTAVGWPACTHVGVYACAHVCAVRAVLLSIAPVSCECEGAHVYACVAGAWVYVCHMLHVFCKVSHSMNEPMACSCRFIEWTKSGVWGGAAVPLKDRWAAASSTDRGCQGNMLHTQEKRKLT